MIGNGHAEIGCDAGFTLRMVFQSPHEAKEPLTDPFLDEGSGDLVKGLGRGRS